MRDLLDPAQGPPPPSPRGRHASEHARGAGRPLRHPRAADQRLRQLLRVLRHVRRRMRRAAHRRRPGPPGPRGRRRRRDGRGRLDRAGHLRPAPPAAARVRSTTSSRSRSTHWPRPPIAPAWAPGCMVAADRTLDPSDAVAQAEVAVRYADRGRGGLRTGQRRGAVAARAVRRGVRDRPRRWPPEHPARRRAGRSGQRGRRARRPRRRPHPARRAGHRGPRAREATGGRGHLPRRVPVVEPAAVGRAVASRPIPCRRSWTPGCAAASTPTIPLLFGPGLLDEYELARSQLGLDDTQLAAIACTSIEASGAPDDLKATALVGVADWLEIR